MYSGMFPSVSTSSPAYADVPPPERPPSSHPASPDIVDEITAWLNEFKPRDVTHGTSAGIDATAATKVASKSIDESSASSNPRLLPSWFYTGSGNTNISSQPHKTGPSPPNSSSSSISTPTDSANAAPRTQLQPPNHSVYATTTVSASEQAHNVEEQESATGHYRLRSPANGVRSYGQGSENLRAEDEDDSIPTYLTSQSGRWYQRQKQWQQLPLARQQEQRGDPWLEHFENLSISPAGRFSFSPSAQHVDQLAHTSGSAIGLTSRGQYIGPFSKQQKSTGLFPSSSSLQASASLTPAMRQELRMQKKYQQPWRRSRAHPAALRAHANAKRQLQMAAILQAASSSQTSSASSTSTDAMAIVDGLENSTVGSATGSAATTTSEKRQIMLPHDIISHIFSYFPSRANAQQYYDKTMPSDLVACSRVNMAWRITALEKIWQTILLPDPMDPSCRKLLYLLASSHSAAKILERSYNLTDIIQRVEIDLMQAVSYITSYGPYSGGDPATFSRAINALIRLVAPFRTLSIQLPQEIDMVEAEALTKSCSHAIFSAVIDASRDAKIQELDMPSAMYCTVRSFPGMLGLISTLKDLRTLILGYSSRDWPLVRSILNLQHLENLCIFDSCWSNQIWIYLLGTLGTRLRGLSIVQGRRPLEGQVLREGIALYCYNLTSLSIPFIQLFQGLSPVLVDDDLVPVIKACHGLQVVNLSGQILLGDGVLEALAELWGLEFLDIRGCQQMTGKSIRRLHWQSIQRVRVFGCDSLSTDFLNLVAMVWQSQRVAAGQLPGSAPSASTSAMTTAPSSIAATPTAATALSPAVPVVQRTHTPHLNAADSAVSTPTLGSPHVAGIRGSRSTSPSPSTMPTPTPQIPPFMGLSVLDFKADHEDPVEMGWVRQREDEPPLDVDEDHFFADWYR
ncbi:hypothetical protein BGW41_003039 [Actinomortierella wolfii]|nr:hypothetical protein BGW41_003039 [Actinomortierella wolfii]